MVGFGGLMAYRDGLSVADIVAFLLYLSLFYGPVTGLANLLEGMQQSLAGAERVLAVLDAPCEIEDRSGAAPIESEKGIGSFCINWANEQCGHLRIDTHGDNTVMRSLLEKLGFIPCGTIYVEEDDFPRLAFEKTSP